MLNICLILQLVNYGAFDGHFKQVDTKDLNQYLCQINFVQNIRNAKMSACQIVCIFYKLVFSILFSVADTL